MAARQQQPQTFGSRLRHRRGVLNLSQKQVARKAGLSVEGYALWEQDKLKQHPHQGNLEKVAKILDTTPYWLLNGYEEVNQSVLDQRMAELRDELGALRRSVADLVSRGEQESG